MTITIRTRHGQPYRRCGVVHGVEPVTHAAGRFTGAERAILRADPWLVVQETPGQVAKGAPAGPVKEVPAKVPKKAPAKPAKGAPVDAVRGR